MELIQQNSSNFQLIKEKTDEKFLCDECDFQTKRLRNLKFHKSSLHEEKKFSCESCGKCYGNLWHLKRHKIEKHENISHKCDQCSFTASWPSGVKRHFKLMHDAESCPPQVCTECNFKSKYKQSLRDHVKSFHLNQDQKECLDCQKVFISKRGYTKHMNTTHG